jgi:hypothetical protein
MKRIILLIAGLLILHSGIAQVPEGPGIDETILWLQEKTDTYARYIVVDSAGLTAEIEFTLNSHEENLCKVQLKETARNIGSVAYHFNFADLDPESVILKSISEVYPDIKIHDDTYLINIHTIKDNDIIFCDRKGIYSGEKFSYQFSIGIRTQEMAERFQKGLKHAIAVCTAKDSLFK